MTHPETAKAGHVHAVLAKGRVSTVTGPKGRQALTGRYFTFADQLLPLFLLLLLLPLLLLLRNTLEVR
ncbi:hypothetical protein MYCTH_2306619 [Thermothelomyces thermophilus ATCC 42464]|uniref:Uncharacterized protein n=1 Tax=Thermothelomyces thermophilus (strain ATCC 42464 / BCRC 31852 / DSM 1799) TaxID=573729 RepID=G2QHN6_THET4|nr:uncharacterized protein MYCTH_2306619 [Thermothelomyces thermophilus ATCC 42464]AEO58896.1 hypothetical protein MYCTH_2306619 [Thermothelomyces thermophilus ATCC 42464]